MTADAEGGQEEQLFHIDLPYAYFGIVVRGTVVVMAPPIAKWALHQDSAKVLSFYRSKGARITRVAPPPQTTPD